MFGLGVFVPLMRTFGGQKTNNNRKVEHMHQIAITIQVFHHPIKSISGHC